MPKRRSEAPRMKRRRKTRRARDMGRRIAKVADVGH
jgi:hypothetical protein